MRNELLNKSYTAEGVIPPYRIAKFGTADGGVLVAAAGADKVIGVTDRIGFAAIGDRGDVVRVGITEVEYGGTVAAGDPLMSDGSGRAIVAAAAAGVNVNVIGRAEVAGVVSDIGSMLIALSTFQG